MNTLLKKSIFIITALLVMLVGFLVPAFADIDIVNSPNAGDGTFERNAENGTYSIRVYLDVKNNHGIKALEANVTFNNQIFETVSLSDQINASSGAIWETSAVDVDYEINGNVTTVKYLKASTNEDKWNVTAGQKPLLYTLTFRIKNNAAVGPEFINFDPNYAKVQDDVLGDVTGQLINFEYQIELDQTAPITSIDIPGGWYPSQRLVDLSTNERNDEATINYTLDGSNPVSSGTKIFGRDPILNITIPQLPNTIRITTLNYYAVDWAKDTVPNAETPFKTQVYYIDTEYPTINAVEYTAGPIGIGATVFVTFNISDASGLVYNTSYPRVNITGHSAGKISGTGMGQYVFSKVLAANDDNGSGFANIQLEVRDRAGNTSTVTIPNAIELDFSGPEFEISVTPNPVQFPNSITINVTASETLLASPTVTIEPGQEAVYVSEDGLHYVYTFTTTANGWNADLPWLGGGSSTPPLITAVAPAESAEYVLIDSDLVIDLSDNGEINTSTLVVTINGELAVLNGASADPASYNVSISGSGSSYRITINPAAVFGYGETVEVKAAVEDTQANLGVLIYSFTTNELPAIVPVVPLAGAVFVDELTNIVIEVTDDAAVATSSIRVTVDGVLAVVGDVSSDTNTFNVAVTQLGDGLRINIDPTAAFSYEQIVTINVLVEDIFGYQSISEYAFTIEPMPVAFIPKGPVTYNYYTITDAVNAASENDTIMIVSGIHDEGSVITINTSMTITAYDGTSANTVISGGLAHRIFYIGLPVVVTFDSISLSEGALTDNGGVCIKIDAQYATVNILNSIITGNETYTYTLEEVLGGAIVAFDKTVRINAAHSLFSNNKAIGNHPLEPTFVPEGAVAYNGTWEVNDCIFENNNSEGNVAVFKYLLVNINNSIVRNNYAENNGCVFNGNIDFNMNANNTVFENNFSNNTDGGSVLLGGINQVLNNCIFVNNGIGSGRGAIGFETEAVFNNCVFWNNKENGVVNKEFWTSRVTLNNCLVPFEDFNDEQGWGRTSFTNLLVGLAPGFVSTPNSDYRLAADSPLINSGTNTAVTETEDIAGNPRIIYDTVDIGAYEYDQIYISAILPADGSIGVPNDDDITFRVRDFAHAESAVGFTLKVDGADYAKGDPEYSIETNNNTTTTDMVVKFTLPAFTVGSQVEATINAATAGGYSLEKTFSFTIDIAPTIRAILPLPDAAGVMPWADISFEVTDNIEVVTSSITVTINRSYGQQRAVVNGGSTASYNVTMIELALDHTGVTIDPDTRFVIAERVTVNIEVRDNNGNVSTAEYAFVIIEDSAGPDAPLTFVAVASPNVRVELTWTHGDQGDVAEFNIYRVQSTEPSGAGTLIATTNSLTTAYNDATVVNGNSYYYYVTAEDIYLNESLPSDYRGAPFIAVADRKAAIQAPAGFTGSPDALVPGARVIYSARFNNIGYAPANNLKLIDSIPEHTTYENASAVADKPVTMNFSEDGSSFMESGYNPDSVVKLRWDLQGKLLPQDSISTSFNVVVD